MNGQKNSPSEVSCCDPGCCGSPSTPEEARRQLTIDFLYLDLAVCTWCQGTEDSLDSALADVTDLLHAAGVDVVVNRMHITSEEQAQKLRFAASPTIRVNGRDVQLEVQESQCESCGDLCGDEVDCRVWAYQGKTYTSPPKAMLVDAILREVYGNACGSGEVADKKFVVPDNLKKFFRRMAEK